MIHNLDLTGGVRAAYDDEDQSFTFVTEDLTQRVTIKLEQVLYAVFQAQEIKPLHFKTDLSQWRGMYGSNSE